jgi:hypothetical protein
MRSIVVLKNTIGEREAYRWVLAHPTAMDPYAQFLTTQDKQRTECKDSMEFI